MKKQLFGFGVLIAVAVVSTLAFNQQNTLKTEVLPPAPGILPAPDAEEHKEEGISEYKEWMNQKRRNQITGEIASEDILGAQKSVAAMLKREGKRGNLTNAFEEVGPSNIGGRTRAILIDPSNPDRMYTGGVAGGLFISNDRANSWEPYTKNPELNGIGVTSMAMSSNGTIYIGTGEVFANPIGQTNTTAAFIGNGIWRSTDGGENFEQLQATIPSNSNSVGAQFAFVPSLEVSPLDPNMVIAGTGAGIMVSYDGGDTWEKGAPATSSLGSRTIQDMALAPNGDIYFSARGAFIKANVSDIAGTEEPLQTKLVTPSGGIIVNHTRLAIDVAPSNPDVVYVIGVAQGRTNGVWRSTDGANTFTQIGPAQSTGFNPVGSQGGYNLDLKVNPADENRVYVAGQLSAWEWTDRSGWYAISNWFTNPSFDPHHMHADHHTIVFHPTNPDIMYFGTDGGVFISENSRVDYPELPVFKPRNNGYNVTQYISIDAGIKGDVIGGAQDNGTSYMNFQGNSINQAVEVGGGDGSYCGISKLNPNALFFSSQFGNMARSANGGESGAQFWDLFIDCEPKNLEGACSGDGTPDCAPDFYAVYEFYEETDINEPDYGKGYIAFATDCGVWVGSDVLDFSKAPRWINVVQGYKLDVPAAITNGTVSALEWSEDGNYIYMGTRNGSVYRISGLDRGEYEYDLGIDTVLSDDRFDPAEFNISTTLIGSFGGRYVNDITVDKNDPDNVVVVLGNYGNSDFVYQATNATTASGPSGNFNSIQGNLPSMPVYSAVIDYYTGDVWVGTERGLFTKLDGETNWEVETNNLPTSPIFSLKQEKIDDLSKDCYITYAGFHGRGVYRYVHDQASAQCETDLGKVVIATAIDETETDFNLELYPNPTVDFLNIDLTGVKGEITIRILDINSKIVSSEVIENNGNGLNKRINVQSYAKGMYFLVLDTEEGTTSRRFVVNR